MFYAEFIKQATDLAGVTDINSTAIEPVTASKAFSLLQTSLLALNTDDRLTFAVDDISVELSKPKLVFWQRNEESPPASSIESSLGIKPDETISAMSTVQTATFFFQTQSEDRNSSISAEAQGYYTDYLVEIPPAYVISNIGKMRMVDYEDFISDYTGDSSVYAFRLEYGRATLHFRIAENIKIGLKRPLDMPKRITDEVKLTGSALNLLKYKIATELIALYGIPQNPAIDQKYSEYMQRHIKNKTKILPPPILNTGLGRLRRL